MALRRWGSTLTVGSSRKNTRGRWSNPAAKLREAALHLAGVGLHQTLRVGRQAHLVEHFGDAGFQGMAPQAVDAAKKAQVFAGDEVGVEGDLLGHQAQPGLEAPG